MALADHDIVRVSGEYEPASVRTLVLDNMELISVAALSKCTRLTTLSLAGNMLHDLRALSNLTELTSIDATNNRISSLKDIRSLSKLTTLRVAGNPLPTDFSALLNDIRSLHSLVRLDIATKDLPYEGTIDLELLRSQLPTLRVFNVLITDTELTKMELPRIMDGEKWKQQDTEFSDCLQACADFSESIRAELATDELLEEKTKSTDATTPAAD
ncbi:hypothetical protein PTSG_10147 [Salpingoeca rosetta]|uniref:Uncharacterized protein n=1 Tax=Salpingoeca rosetta (strain ATCC 50818 / BSB-021) TaxID=946362 RepID=F2UQF8_SALR5|nr:uncharacterized protein PTSG_10147 [Salpingoeca rosetta]EGD79863.1 hypothetical protein PTSG_10147 [Salpingoeca rosetta]|eukprot:XP_004988484.1 hypothetical protein PTSG_10147 [Salpingoeca rosetta]